MDPPRSDRIAICEQSEDGGSKKVNAWDVKFQNSQLKSEWK